MLNETIHIVNMGGTTLMTSLRISQGFLNLKTCEKNITKKIIKEEEDEI